MIVVTAPTSQIGSQLLPRLLAAQIPVRVIVRNASKLPPDVRTRVEIVEGSHADAATVERAFDGARSLFWLVPANPKAVSVAQAYVDFSHPAATAIKASSINHVVEITALGRGTAQATDAGYVTGSLAMDDLIASTGVHQRALAMPSFMDNILMQLRALREKRAFFLPIPGDLELPSCSTDDIAAVAARWLLDETWVGQQEVPVLGPENISFNQMARIMSEVLNLEIAYQQIPLDAYKAQFLSFGFSEAMAEGMTAMARAKGEGLDLGATRMPENSTPTHFRQWCETVLKPAFQA
ncbi:NAD(P)H-binding protein [Brenneria goodwinii]|uniref:NmrA family NAD(P)-binding protein n=1 Tax=Brenneria goodwinii TaxID=1109412 RepID=UPI000EF2951F|nr:NAD(P)H-binding protein [Brenneria goodwinii]MCG8157258.1 NAD(P)H-binding protein [Brenneria goodwinii]MCG8162212.1 NAD(P)H-binding protein [Brenneria goodwinii]MCG8166142.1 NAD(P)H-binding protein [Brenneria goodwinii]MCG8170769.1 NAD(P)H-binding protein [Brenneria goodwinii]MCG8175838.1 NAD(P)H-binding protein [Brenneria goodwinii]